MPDRPADDNSASRPREAEAVEVPIEGSEGEAPPQAGDSTEAERSDEEALSPEEELLRVAPEDRPGRVEAQLVVRPLVVVDGARLGERDGARRSRN